MDEIPQEQALAIIPKPQLFIEVKNCGTYAISHGEKRGCYATIVRTPDDQVVHDLGLHSSESILSWKVLFEKLGYEITIKQE